MQNYFFDHILKKSNCIVNSLLNNKVKMGFSEKEKSSTSIIINQIISNTKSMSLFSEENRVFFFNYFLGFIITVFEVHNSQNYPANGFA